MKIELKKGEKIRVTLEDTDGWIEVDYDSNDQGHLLVVTDMPDTAGRGGVIYDEHFGAGLPDQADIDAQAEPLPYDGNGRDMGTVQGIRPTLFDLSVLKKKGLKKLFAKAGLSTVDHSSREDYETTLNQLLTKPEIYPARYRLTMDDLPKKCRTEKWHREYWTVEGVGDLRELDRDAAVSFLKQISIQCYPNETDEVIREAVRANLLDGSMPKDWIDLSDPDIEELLEDIR